MNNVALILAAHGSRIDTSSNAALWKLAERIRLQSTFSEVTCAFHHGAPGFADVLGTVRSRRVVVVPIMTSEGYYSRFALPRALASCTDCELLTPNLSDPQATEIPFPVRQTGRDEGQCTGTSTRRTVQITRPIGVHPEIPNLMHRRLNHLLARFRLSANETSVAVIGHGTPRNANSKIATNDLAASLRRMGPCDDVFPAFLDEEPFVETVPDRAKNDTIVALLFLVAAGPHALVDVPRRIGLAAMPESFVSTEPPPLQRGDTGGSPFESPSFPFIGNEGSCSSSPPFCGRVGGKTIMIDEAFGTDPAIVPLIIDLANSAAQGIELEDLPHIQGGKFVISCPPVLQ